MEVVSPEERGTSGDALKGLDVGVREDSWHLGTGRGEAEERKTRDGHVPAELG